MSSYQTALQNENIITHIEAERHGTVRAERTDNQLVDQVLAGDTYAFEEIFERLKRLVAIVSSRYFRRPEIIEEMVQTAFAKAFSDLHTFRGKYDRSFSSWLSTITANACFDALRKQKRRPERLTCELSEHESQALLDLTGENHRSAEKELSDLDLANKLLASLPEEDQVLLGMLYSEEMSVADIAEIHGLTESNVKVRAWRARKTLRKLVKKYL